MNKSKEGHMLSKKTYDAYILILKSELVPALGCTEPIAVAYAAARATELLGRRPERVEMRCSGNIIKNVKSVTVPNTGGMKGLAAAAVAGIVGGEASRGLQVLESVRESQYPEIQRLVESGLCAVSLAEGVENLYIAAHVAAGEDSAEVRIEGSHTNITYAARNGVEVGEEDASGSTSAASAAPGGAMDRRLHEAMELLNVRDILTFAGEVIIGDIDEVISEQIRMNTAIADEGLAHHYGVDVGKTLLKNRGDDLRTRAKARAAAGSDARMSGCSMPVVINSGSGNQGMTVSLPVVEYAKELGSSRDKLYRALVLSNLVAIHQKALIGKLSAYCGAVSAACGSGAGITYLCGGGYEEIAATITNTIANIGGMVCDGAKPSCAAKIASAVDAAIMAHDMAAEGKVFGPGEGLVRGDVEGTIDNIGRMGKVGMKETDVEILNMMIDEEKGPKDRN